MITASPLDKYIFNGVAPTRHIDQDAGFMEFFQRIRNNPLRYSSHSDTWQSPLLPDLRFSRTLGIGTVGLVLEAGPYAIKIMNFPPCESLRSEYIHEGETMEYLHAAYASHLGVGPKVHACGWLMFENEGQRRGILGSWSDIRKREGYPSWRFDTNTTYYYICMDRWDDSLQTFTTGSSFERTIWQIRGDVILAFLEKVRRLNEHGMIHFDIVAKNILLRFRQSGSRTLPCVEEMCLADFSYTSSEREFSFQLSSRGIPDLLCYYRALPDAQGHIPALKSAFGYTDTEMLTWLRNDAYNFDRIFAIRVFQTLSGLRPAGTHFPADYYWTNPEIPRGYPVDMMGNVWVYVYLDMNLVSAFLFYAKERLNFVRDQINSFLMQDTSFVFKLHDPELDVFLRVDAEITTLLFEAITVVGDASACQLYLSSTQETKMID